MNRAQIAALLELIEELVSGPEPWPDKKKAVTEQASDRQQTALQEFCIWFEEDNT